MVNVTDFASAITDGNVQRVYQNMMLNNSSVMHDDNLHEPKISNFTGPDNAGKPLLSFTDQASDQCNQVISGHVRLRMQPHQILAIMIVSFAKIELHGI